MTTSTRSHRRWLAEGLGTFFLVLIGPGAAVVNAFSGGAVTHVGVALAFTFVITAMIVTLGHVSGAHINPAVTVAFWSSGRFPRREVIPYVAAQLGSAIAAALTLKGIFGAAVSAAATVPIVPQASAFALEWLLSFVLMLVIMAVATDSRVPAGFAAIAIGMTVGFCALMGGPITGASMNPARSFGPAVGAGVWTGHWLYWLAPLTAMPVAARVYDALRGTAPPGAPESGATA